MKTDRNILVAFYLNMFFSVVEFIGGALTGSVAIISDSIHDFGDGLSIGASFILEKISKKKPDSKYTYGYYRYSVLGSVLQSVILLCGAILVVYNAVLRFIHPEPIHHNGMIVIAVFGLIINGAAVFFTSGEGSLNQKSINLHMLEDLLGWLIVLIGAVIMKFTQWNYLDPILSILLALFIAVNALKNLHSVLDIFLEKTPKGIDLDDLTCHLQHIDGVIDVHHLHVWSMDGYQNAATLHAVTEADMTFVKKEIREELKEHGICHVTIECEKPGEICPEEHCNGAIAEHGHHHHHHHHHH